MAGSSPATSGNMTAGAGRSVSYIAFNMAESMVQGSDRLCWYYDSEHQRVKLNTATTSCNSPTTTTYYLNDSISGLMSEKIDSGSTISTKDYLSVAGLTVGLRTKVGAAAATIAYYVTDHLGSIAATTDEAGLLVCRLSYDPWGKSTASGSGCTAPTRGFTGEESVSNGAITNLVNLNARVYDPVLARFMAADPILANPFDSQNLNGYSYVLNSPLAYTDPTGMTSAPVEFDLPPEQVSIIAFRSVCSLLTCGSNGGLGDFYWVGNYVFSWSGLYSSWAYMSPPEIRPPGLNGGQSGQLIRGGPTSAVPVVIGQSTYGSTLIQYPLNGFGNGENSKTGAYGQGNTDETHPVSDELADLPAEIAISILENLQSTYDDFAANPSLRSAASLEVAILSVLPGKRVATGVESEITKTIRSTTAKREFLRTLASHPFTPRWMKQWLSAGRNPPGYVVHHPKPLSVGGADNASNMRLITKSDHDLIHKFDRPWEK